MARVNDSDPIIGNPDLLQRGEPLAQALRTIRVTGVLSSNIQIGNGSWSTSIPHPEDCVILYIVTQGRCVGGALEPRQLVDLDEGDALLLPRAGRCLMAKSRDIPPVPLEELLERELGGIDGVEAKWRSLFSLPFTHGVTGETSVALTALRMFFDHEFQSVLVDGLPAVVHLPKFVQRNRSLVETILPQIARQGELGLPGQGTATRLAEAVLVSFLSEFLADFGADRPGFHRGLRDPYLSKVIGAIQANPKAEWMLTEMARSAGLSRSAFAERFRSVMNMTPTQFVTAVRMAKAADLLQHSKVAIAQIAELIGYSSEAAFSRAFRKWSGTPPGAVRRTIAGSRGGIVDAGS